jgi:hypothetical protein
LRWEYGVDKYQVILAQSSHESTTLLYFMISVSRLAFSAGMLMVIYLCIQPLTWAKNRPQATEKLEAANFWQQQRAHLQEHDDSLRNVPENWRTWGHRMAGGLEDRHSFLPLLQVPEVYGHFALRLAQHYTLSELEAWNSWRVSPHHRQLMQLTDRFNRMLKNEQPNLRHIILNVLPTLSTQNHQILAQSFLSFALPLLDASDRFKASLNPNWSEHRRQQAKRQWHEKLVRWVVQGFSEKELQELAGILEFFNKTSKGLTFVDHLSKVREEAMADSLQHSWLRLILQHQSVLSRQDISMAQHQAASQTEPRRTQVLRQHLASTVCRRLGPLRDLAVVCSKAALPAA